MWHGMYLSWFGIPWVVDFIFPICLICFHLFLLIEYLSKALKLEAKCWECGKFDELFENQALVEILPKNLRKTKCIVQFSVDKCLCISSSRSICLSRGCWQSTFWLRTTLLFWNASSSSWISTTTPLSSRSRPSASSSFTMRWVTFSIRNILVQINEEYLVEPHSFEKRGCLNIFPNTFSG